MNALKKASQLLIYGAALCCLFVSCRDSVTNSDSRQTLKISFRITSADGVPLENVGVHFYEDFGIFGSANSRVMNYREVEDIDSGTVLVSNLIPAQYKLYRNYPNPFNSRATNIEFEIPRSQRVQLQVKNWWNSEPVMTVIDEVLSAGRHLVMWRGQDDEGRYVTNNIYLYELRTEEFMDSHELFLDEIDPEALDYYNPVPLSNSDSSGMAEVAYEVLPIGKEVVQLLADGREVGTLTISDTLSFVFTRGGFQPAVEEVFVDMTRAVNVSVVMQKLETKD